MAKRKLQIDAPVTDEIPDNIQGAARELLGKMVEGWVARRVGAKRHQQKTVASAVRILFRFFGHAGKIPGQLVQDDFDKWALHLARSGNVNVHTQRHYYSHVGQFLAYLLGNANLRNQARRLFGSDIIQLVTEEASIPHRLTRECDEDAQVGAFTHEQIDEFFSAIDRLIAYQHRHGTKKSLLPLLRDKTLFSLMYACGLRISETAGVSLDSFEPNQKFPEFGDFGFVRVFGKGSKWRTPPIMVLETATLLTYYKDEIRPMFLDLVSSDPNEKAFFLTERGKRISTGAIYNRFVNVLREAGMEGLGLHPHMLRHSSVTHHGLAGLEMESLRQMHGHEYSATTQTYFNVPDEFVADDFSAATSRYIDNARQSGKKV